MSNLSIWDYDQSVERVKSMTIKWSNLTVEIVRELHEARKQLSNSGARSDLVPNGTRLHTWEGFLLDAAISRRTAHNWLERFVPEENKLLSHEEFQERKQINHTPPSKSQQSIRNIKLDADTEETIKKMFESPNRPQPSSGNAGFSSGSTRTLVDGILGEHREISTAKEKLRLNVRGDDLNQEAMFDIINEYLNNASDTSRKIETAQNLIKYLRTIIVQFQRKASA